MIQIPLPCLQFSDLPFIMILFMGTMFGWFWTNGNGLQHKFPPMAKMNTGMFKIFFVVPLLYILIFLTGFGILMGGLSEGLENADDGGVGWILGSMALIVPLHLFSMFCIFNCLYFVARTLKTIELQRETSFSDFAGEFFLIWLYFVGIWIIQPRINRMVEQNL